MGFECLDSIQKTNAHNSSNSDTSNILLTSNILNSNASTTANIVKDNDGKNPNVASQINSNLDTSYYTNTDGSYSKVHNLECSMVNMKHIASVISDALKETSQYTLNVSQDILDDR